jgi:hypothetical protein
MRVYCGAGAAECTCSWPCDLLHSSPQDVIHQSSGPMQVLPVLKLLHACMVLAGHWPVHWTGASLAGCMSRLLT